MSDCEYCSELRGLADSRFSRFYEGVCGCRIVAHTRNFVAMPTIGQIFPGSLLLLPHEHVETCAQLPTVLQDELVGLLESVLPTVGYFGAPIVFEHGASALLGGGCGIHHAHLHVVPIPERTSLEVLFQPYVGRRSRSLQDALAALAGCDEYLLVGDGEAVLHSSVTSMTPRPQSQHFRRTLAAKFAAETPWDWRTVTGPEAGVLSTLEAFGVGHVS